jgi:hypothetical protein
MPTTAVCCPWSALRGDTLRHPNDCAKAGGQPLGRRAVPAPGVDRRHPTGFRVILTAGLVALYLAGCLAALALLAQLWAPSL